MPYECQQAGITDFEQCGNLMREKPGTQSSLNGMLPPQSGSKEMLPPPLPPGQMLQKMMPRECQEAGVITKDDCEKIMAKKYGNQMGPAMGIQGSPFPNMPNMKEPPKDMIMMMRPSIGGFGFNPDLNQMKEQEIQIRIESELRSGEASDCKGKDVNRCREILKEKFEKEMGEKNYLPPECEQAGIKDQAQCQQTLMQVNMPPPCQEASITDPDECQKLMFKKNMPPECEQAGASSPKDCEKIIVKKMLPPDCQAKNITDPRECEKLMIQKHMPAKCKEKGITEMPECEKTLSQMYAPKICAEAGAMNPAECQKVIVKTYGQPKECEGLSELECMGLIKQGKAGQEIMAKLNKNMPLKCRELGAKTMFECEELSMKKNVPTECQEAGAFTKDACDKVMMEKYRPSDADIKQLMPKPCADAGAKTREECDEIMDKFYLPRECKEAGITTRQECDLLMQKVNTPAECQAVGAFDRAVCEQVMRAKFAAPECKEAGITDQTACESLMMEKYAKKVKCDGLTDDLCQIAIEKRHLGQIIKKEKELADIKEKFEPLIGKNLKIGVKEKSLITADQLKATEANTETTAGETRLETPAITEASEDIQALIPISPEKEINLLVVPAVETSVILEDETLVQTASAVIMFDDDADGLPNDIEERLGSNPEDSDTDNDGYTDLNELQTNHNPLGQGDIWDSGLALEISDFDQALINERPIGQPIAAGEAAPEELIIEASEMVAVLEPPAESAPAPAAEPTGFFGIKPIYAKEAAKTQLKLKGKATPNTVIAIFIYSNLSVVATTKTDALGRFEYIIDQPLTDGQHTVYIATISGAGKVIKKSSGFPLFIKEARAVSAQDLIKGDLNIETKFNYWQLIIIIVIIAVLVGLAYLLYCRKKGKSINFLKFLKLKFPKLPPNFPKPPMTKEKP